VDQCGLPEDVHHGRDLLYPFPRTVWRGHELPNLSAWNETCAAYGNVVWNHRMFLLYRDAQYLDVMERVLYNGFLDGVSLKGDRFFYQNPLTSFGNYLRFEWINTPCCPPNVVRLIASLPAYIYAQAPGVVYVNLFIGRRARLTVHGIAVTLAQRDAVFMGRPYSHSGGSRPPGELRARGAHTALVPRAGGALRSLSFRR
jgi:hypothetical protein